MEKKIEDMARVIGSAIEFDRYDFCMEGKTEIIAEKAAKAFYNASYRKQTEGEWIDRYKGEFVNPIYICSICEKGTLLKPQIDVLGNMEMVQALSAFCPNCGAHMRGGAE